MGGLCSCTNYLPIIPHPSCSGNHVANTSIPISKMVLDWCLLICFSVSFFGCQNAKRPQCKSSFQFPDPGYNLVPWSMFLQRVQINPPWWPYTVRHLSEKPYVLRVDLSQKLWTLMIFTAPSAPALDSLRQLLLPWLQCMPSPQMWIHSLKMHMWSRKFT